MDNNINWIQLGIGFLSGGAFGALIKQFFDYRRNRVQPIGYSIELKSVYNLKDTQLENTLITINEGKKEYKFSTLYIGSIKIQNIGLTDFMNFSFGFTLTDEIKFIQCKSNTKDRHHVAELINEPTLENQVDSFDVNLKPFNRKDEYLCDVLLTGSNLLTSDDFFNISASVPVKLTNMLTAKEVSYYVATSTFKSMNSNNNGFFVHMDYIGFIETLVKGIPNILKKKIKMKQ